MENPESNNGFEPKITAWETKEAHFLQIEFSPMYMLKIQVDKEVYRKRV